MARKSASLQIWIAGLSLSSRHFWQLAEASGGVGRQLQKETLSSEVKLEKANEIETLNGAGMCEDLKESRTWLVRRENCNTYTATPLDPVTCTSGVGRV